MDIYKLNFRIKWIIVLLGIIVIAGSLVYTDYLAKRLVERERKLIDLYAKALETAATQEPDANMAFLSEKIINANTSVPVILTDETGEPLSSKNIVLPGNVSKEKEDLFLKQQILLMAAQHEPISIEFYGMKNYVYYKDSEILTMLRYYPYIQLTAIVFLSLAGYVAFNYSKKAEQSKVWVGLAKETAHQLGTPLSSLFAIRDYFKEIEPFKSDPMTEELAKDVDRLNVITARFSQIGLEGKLTPENVANVIEENIDYLKSRTSSYVSYSMEDFTDGATAVMNISLMGWVIENICKNAIDAMDGRGSIHISILTVKNTICIDIKDSGKGIPNNKIKTIFKPGFTTKKRGWGLGLTLVKRIVEEYHGGKVYVLQSGIDKGTTFRIELKGVQST
ncbi:sensor histidine kinase [Cytophaga hutchinsonii]|uniref:histidine kinase n=1 Tax=Cytophaga hutchinsonii (strain ATCC 33406 / DSM 1761 / CIP 103989 / NBRC 15051 / NCIMB 9469 / D465) TaxID=269798 RepID=A0A6N4SMX6_CYTH3|nr:ATP-binding protein [Cytophaga hutchinsonii]ABG57624.1 sensor histidine kinase [Cytophaga hutchinsonii ATCC 33406]SFX01392.1 Histidine kinase-, DNA gyrase B-, and HSP90-like ATPase [Cytophaga hutchinsonii ATCC 33406]